MSYLVGMFYSDDGIVLTEIELLVFANCCLNFDKIMNISDYHLFSIPFTPNRFYMCVYPTVHQL